MRNGDPLIPREPHNDSPLVQKEPNIKRLTPFDYLVRLRFSGVSSDIDIAIHPTEAVVSEFRSFLNEIKGRESVLVEVIKKQKDLIDYNGHYNSFLLNQINEDEFNRISENFSFSPVSCDESEVGKKTLILLYATGIPFSAADLAYFWGCPEEQIEAVLTKLEKEKTIE